MTTRVHVINFGPDKIVIDKINPKTSEVGSSPKTVWPQQYVDEFVYDIQTLIIREEKATNETASQ